jgi:hypothetical protein
VSCLALSVRPALLALLALREQLAPKALLVPLALAFLLAARLGSS